MPLNLIIFAKAPQMGIVKRRLAKDIGYINATFWYKSQLTTLVREFNRKLPLRKYLFITPSNSKNIFNHCAKGNWEIKYQSKGDLGQRMADAMMRVGNGPRVLIGSDIPDVKYDHIKKAFETLGRSKAVFGPADDGGYWLIGIASGQKLPKMKNVRWSTRHALDDTIKCFDPKVTIRYIKTLSDIDNGQDFKRLYSRRSAG
ncbi:TIGR04282 family arsenosugar biosynthesis glycosyltransferase [Rhodospirillaceae bacterium]|nr:TIGR04282 family arsenosugar biosynthesis glycosyltransferase [Rhodospirillaceae bacterium]